MQFVFLSLKLLFIQTPGSEKLDFLYIICGVGHLTSFILWGRFICFGLFLVTSKKVPGSLRVAQSYLSFWMCLRSRINSKTCFLKFPKKLNSKSSQDRPAWRAKYSHVPRGSFQRVRSSAHRTKQKVSYIY